MLCFLITRKKKGMVLSTNEKRCQFLYTLPSSIKNLDKKALLRTHMDQPNKVTKETLNRFTILTLDKHLRVEPVAQELDQCRRLRNFLKKASVQPADITFLHQQFRKGLVVSPVPLEEWTLCEDVKKFNMDVWLGPKAVGRLKCSSPEVVVQGIRDLLGNRSKKRLSLQELKGIQTKKKSRERDRIRDELKVLKGLVYHPSYDNVRCRTGIVSKDGHFQSVCLRELYHLILQHELSSINYDDYDDLESTIPQKDKKYLDRSLAYFLDDQTQDDINQIIHEKPVVVVVQNPNNVKNPVDPSEARPKLQEDVIINKLVNVILDAIEQAGGRITQDDVKNGIEGERVIRYNRCDGIYLFKSLPEIHCQDGNLDDEGKRFIDDLEKEFKLLADIYDKSLTEDFKNWFTRLFGFGGDDSNYRYIGTMRKGKFDTLPVDYVAKLAQVYLRHKCKRMDVTCEEIPKDRPLYNEKESFQAKLQEKTSGWVGTQNIINTLKKLEGDVPVKWIALAMECAKGTDAPDVVQHSKPQKKKKQV